MKGSLAIGLPHATKIIRKPKPVGLEIKDVACGETRIILRMEMVVRKEVMQKKEFVVHGLIRPSWHSRRPPINSSVAWYRSDCGW